MEGGRGGARAPQEGRREGVVGLSLDGTFRRWSSGSKSKEEVIREREMEDGVFLYSAATRLKNGVST